MTKEIAENTLFYGDNLTILRDHVPDESIDLVYLLISLEGDKQ